MDDRTNTPAAAEDFRLRLAREGLAEFETADVAGEINGEGWARWTGKLSVLLANLIKLYDEQKTARETDRERLADLVRRTERVLDDLTRRREEVDATLTALKRDAQRRIDAVTDWDVDLPGDDVQAAFHAGYHAGRHGGDVAAHFRSYMTWKADQQ